QLALQPLLVPNPVCEWHRNRLCSPPRGAGPAAIKGAVGPSSPGPAHNPCPSPIPAPNPHHSLIPAPNPHPSPHPSSLYPPQPHSQPHPSSQSPSQPHSRPWAAPPPLPPRCCASWGSPQPSSGSDWRAARWPGTRASTAGCWCPSSCSCAAGTWRRCPALSAPPAGRSSCASRALPTCAGTAPPSSVPPASAPTCSQVLSDSLDTRCKCHGVSGSCSVKTCWKGLPDLGEIASDLKSRYLAALKVTHRLVGPRKQLIPKEGDARPVTEMDLVYLISSPDYCTPNPQLGSLGTQDRPCNRSSVGSDSCDLLCCGRGYNTYTEEVQERCHCRYRWCCSVVCRRCRRSLDRHVCK
uniref:Protein Wnt n=1 Tax=Zonotrichia albicollis TaxID=44394 RepID=A0A8D2N5I0_ZONAL